eukprot:16211757-Heterocapsa_arctica.AAC.1
MYIATSPICYPDIDMFDSSFATSPLAGHPAGRQATCGYADCAAANANNCAAGTPALRSK